MTARARGTPHSSAATVLNFAACQVLRMEGLEDDANAWFKKFDDIQQLRMVRSLAAHCLVEGCRTHAPARTEGEQELQRQQVRGCSAAVRRGACEAWPGSIRRS